ncbi:exonuclease SbcCD subunit D [Nitrosopumilus sp. b3]|uniref:metallophosphoesterase family protein n=1 Tax=Nitrosopumilus sp. b3 TaxID=2109909 RepID=UPI0015F625A5|nr:exonuclease SbcCD subunit D [Nitrosopumilus sp. b3]
MKIVHFSDTHLGHSDYGKFDSESGINKRENDVYQVFKEIVDHIIKAKPDLAIHAGDLFDSIRPSNRAISIALEQLSRLSKEKIPTVIIAGNHSTPRQKSTDTIFKILQYFPDIYPVFGGKYEKLKIGDCSIHAIPHSYSDEDLQEGIKKLKPDKSSKYNIMVAHAAIRGVEEASWGEFKEQTIPVSALKSDFDYIALGHYHRFLKIKDNAYYCGSPERISFNEVNDKKGFLEVTLDDFSVKHVPTTARDMLIFKPIECEKLSATEIVTELEKMVSGKINDKIVKVFFNNIPRHVHSSLDLQKIRQIMSNALHYEPVYNWKFDDSSNMVSSQIGSINEEFENYLKNIELEKKELEEIKSLGNEYLNNVIEEEA